MGLFVLRSFFAAYEILNVRRQLIYKIHFATRAPFLRKLSVSIVLSFLRDQNHPSNHQITPLFPVALGTTVQAALESASLKKLPDLQCRRTWSNSFKHQIFSHWLLDNAFDIAIPF